MEDKSVDFNERLQAASRINAGNKAVLMDGTGIYGERCYFMQIPPLKCLWINHYFCNVKKWARGLWQDRLRGWLPTGRLLGIRKPIPKELIFSISNVCCGASNSKITSDLWRYRARDWTESHFLKLHFSFGAHVGKSQTWCRWPIRLVLIIMQHTEKSTRQRENKSRWPDLKRLAEKVERHLESTFFSDVLTGTSKVRMTSRHVISWQVQTPHARWPHWRWFQEQRHCKSKRPPT